ncbi:MAG: hypothetical protein ACFFG0_39185 [Candidatus Thorarchaeota archaeon]
MVEFYPKHIEKEDKNFIIPIMQYFTKEEQDSFLHERQAFDRKMIQRKYNEIVTKYENEQELFYNNQNLDWINYI